MSDIDAKWQDRFLGDSLSSPHIGCVCLTFLHCVFSNWSNWYWQRIRCLLARVFVDASVLQFRPPGSMTRLSWRRSSMHWGLLIIIVIVDIYEKSDSNRTSAKNCPKIMFVNKVIYYRFKLINISIWFMISRPTTGRCAKLKWKSGNSAKITI